MTSEADRFADKVEPEPNSGCWLWAGCLNPKGYGQFRGGGKTRLAHRYAYQAAFGDIPAGMLVCHKCDNPSCVNTDHLFVGAAADNTADMMRKGRNVAPTGLRNGKAKLSDEQVMAMRERHVSGIGRHQLAVEYAVTYRHVGNIVTGKVRKKAGGPLVEKCR